MIETSSKPCWRKNGTWGDENPRCEKLKFVEHCRSCDVFVKAAREVMVSDTDEKGFDGGLLSFDALVQRQRLSGDLSILPVRIDQYCFAISCHQIVTIHDHIPIHSVPFNRNKVIKGVVAINHEIFTFVDIVKLLSLPLIEKTDSKKYKIGLYKRVLVVNFDSRVMAFYVDEVYKISHYFQAAVDEGFADQFLKKISNGHLLEEKAWCGDCHILDATKVSQEFEQTFL